MKKVAHRFRILRRALMLAGVMLFTFTAGATEFFYNVKLIGGTKSEVNALKESLTSKGWKLIDYDLNKGCGSESDYIYLLYYPARLSDTDQFVTDFYLRNDRLNNVSCPESLEHNGRTYYLVPYEGGSDFKSSKGNLNSNAGGDFLHLYYTKDEFPDNRAVTSVSFDSNFHGAIDQNGNSDSDGFDLNAGVALSETFYMHFITQRKAEHLIGEVKVIGGSKDKVNSLKATYRNQGWTIIDKDLNAGCGSGSDYIYLMYKTTDNANDGQFITDLYISNIKYQTSVEHDNRHYTRVPYDGSDHFVALAGDLNSNAGGADIHLFYTTDPFPDNRAVFDIEVNNYNINALGVNGGAEGYDLNTGCSGSEQLYLHLANWTVPNSWGQATADDPLMLRNKAGWDEFTASIAGGRTFDGEYVRLANDIDGITTMAGTADYSFSGHFDGCGYTLGLNLCASEDLCALFRYLNNASISNLAVSGTVNSAGHRQAAGLAGRVSGTTSISDCSITATISSSYKGDSSIGGMAAHIDKNVSLTIANSVFKGAFNCPNAYALGGFIGWEPTTGGSPYVTFNNCLFAPTAIVATSKDSRPSSTYVRIENNADCATFDQSYYTQTLGTPQGSPVKTTLIEGEWDEPVVAADGLTYYATNVALKAMPYVYGFDNSLEEEGWRMYDNADGTGIAYHNNWNSNAFTFNYADTRQYLISAKLDGSVAIRVSFRHKAVTEGIVRRFSVGYSTTDTSPESFTWDEEIGSELTMRQYEHIFPRGIRYIAVRCEAGSVVMHLDDFSFQYCLTPPPVNVSLTHMAETTVMLTWETPNADDPILRYDYEYKKTDDTEWTGGTSNTTSATLSGLEADTEYLFRVRAQFSGNQQSDFLPFSFVTAKPLPFGCGFENGMDGWDVVNPRNMGSLTVSGISTRGSQNGTYCFRFATDSDRANRPQYLISPPLTDDAIKQFVYYYRGNGLGYLERFQVGYSTTTRDPEAFLWDDEITTYNSSSWTKGERIFPEGCRYIAIRQTSSNGFELFFDDVSIEEYSTHAKPRNLTVTDLPAEGATRLTWSVPQETPAGYAYQYKTSGENTWPAAIVTDATTVTLSGLPLNTEYQFRVKALYANNESSNYVMAYFISDGGVEQLPCAQDFENGMGGWRLKKGLARTRIHPYRWHNGANCFFFYPTMPDEQGTIIMNPNPQYLISPQFDGKESMKVSLYYYSGDEPGYPSWMQVGYSTTTNDIAAFTWDEVITVDNTEWKQLFTYCPKGTKYVAFKWVKGHSLFLDDILIEISQDDNGNSTTPPTDVPFIPYPAKAEDKQEGSWYTIDGRLLEQAPTAPGLYMYNGETILLK